MDNMLYIIVGLVVILLIAVLVMRKNNAQKSSEQPGIQSGKIKPLSKQAGSKITPAQTATSQEKKFDHVEIAQRFMDQQRYDKAIETLNRGLIEKPNDSQMSLKLLAIYATIDDSESFNKSYDSIKANNDEKSMAQADELKALLTVEQEQIAKHALPVDNSQNGEFESLDFDLPTDKALQNNPVDAAAENVVYKNDLSESTHEPIIASTNLADSHFESGNFEDIEQTFDLSLSDLEDNASGTTDISAAPVTTFDLVDDNILTPSASVIENDIDSNNIDADFDFDWSEQSPVSNESPVEVTTEDGTDSQSSELTLDDEFVLDLADSDIGADSIGNSEGLNNETGTSDIDNNGLTLSLDSDDVAHETPTQTGIQQPTTLDSLDDFSFEDISIEDANVEGISIEELGTIKNEPNASSMAPTTLMFDDNTVIDDDFDFDNLSEPTTTSMPVESEQSGYIDDAIEVAPFANITSAEDFSSQFAADFDFVKTLDSNQVTLDLAGQYLQLGEYDSAKRLLNEVIAQGNSEQQEQAQRLLERTA